MDSLTKLGKSFSKVIPRDFKSNQFVDLLEDLKLEAEINEGSSGNGRMAIVRTSNNLPGTRYIHAQFFGEGPKEFMQHLSFEFEKGEGAFEEAIAMVKNNYPIFPETEYKNGNFTMWALPDGYEVWVKEMTKEDLERDLFNAYDSDNDSGTIRVTVELKMN